MIPYTLTPTPPWVLRARGLTGFAPGLALSHCGQRCAVQVQNRPFPPLPLMFPVAASRSGLSKAPSRKKKGSKGPVIQITEMSEKYFSQESEVSE